MAHHLPPTHDGKFPQSPNSLKLLLTLAAAVPGSYAVVYCGERVIGYVGPFLSLYEVVFGIFAIALAIGGTAYQIIRHNRP
jgi:hypothetical protein